MTIYEGYRFIREALCNIYDRREAGNIATLVMEKITGMRRTDRLLYKDHILPEEQEALLVRYTTLLLEHHPVQYVLGEAWFYGISLYVDENVLIPRPETEELVEWIVKDEGDRLQVAGCRSQVAGLRLQVTGNQVGGGPTILDVGTGSGCIAIALKRNIPGANVYAADISSKALAVARQNASAQETPIDFLHIDFLDPHHRNALPLFDIIVSNPPYIPLKDKAAMHKNVVNHEPHSALFVKDNDPLLFYSAVADFALRHLQPSGCIYMEIHESMGKAVEDIFVQHGFAKTAIRKDMQGKDRMIKATVTN